MSRKFTLTEEMIARAKELRSGRKTYREISSALNTEFDTSVSRVQMMYYLDPQYRQQTLLNSKKTYKTKKRAKISSIIQDTGLKKKYGKKAVDLILETAVDLKGRCPSHKLAALATVILEKEGMPVDIDKIAAEFSANSSMMIQYYKRFKSGQILETGIRRYKRIKHEKIVEHVEASGLEKYGEKVVKAIIEEAENANMSGFRYDVAVAGISCYVLRQLDIPVTFGELAINFDIKPKYIANSYKYFCKQKGHIPPLPKTEKFIKRGIAEFDAFATCNKKTKKLLEENALKYYSEYKELKRFKPNARAAFCLYNVGINMNISGTNQEKLGDVLDVSDCDIRLINKELRNNR